MLTDAGVSFLNEYWPSLVLAVLVVVLMVLLRRASGRIRAIERTLHKLHREVIQLRQIEGRRLLENMRSASTAVKPDEGDHLSIVPEVVADKSKSNGNFPTPQDST